MSGDVQEGYRDLGWIIDRSQRGLFLVVADEPVQSEIVRIYGKGAVGIYDCRRHPGAYYFRNLQEWAEGFPQTGSFLIANFHMALQDEQSIRRLNFSRDMLDGLGKNLIFLVTPYMDDRLATGAYDFYSFLKLRVVFADYGSSCVDEAHFAAIENELRYDEWQSGDFKQRMAEANALIGQAGDERSRSHYEKSRQLLLKAREIKEYLLGPKHLEMAEIYRELAKVYEGQAKYREAEKLYRMGLQIRKEVLGGEHPDTAFLYHDLASLYEKQGRYGEAREALREAAAGAQEKLD